jgi:DNA-binding MarR family transcriptional regulator
MSTDSAQRQESNGTNHDPEQSRLTARGLERQTTLDDARDTSLPDAVPAAHLVASDGGDGPITPLDPADCPACGRLACWAHAQRGFASHRVDGDGVDRGDGLATDGGQLLDEDDDTVHPTDLSQFQLNILRALGRGDDYGLGIKRALEDYYGKAVNHGRLYPNLDTLVEEGLVEKSQRDRRTNEYAITDAGEDLLADRVEWLAAPFREVDGDA